MDKQLANYSRTICSSFLQFDIVPIQIWVWCLRRFMIWARTVHSFSILRLIFWCIFLWTCDNMLSKLVSSYGCDGHQAPKLIYEMGWDHFPFIFLTSRIFVDRRTHANDSSSFIYSIVVTPELSLHVILSSQQLPTVIGWLLGRVLSIQYYKLLYDDRGLYVDIPTRVMPFESHAHVRTWLVCTHIQNYHWHDPMKFRFGRSGAALGL